jgi:bZIP-type transcription factor MBZ1
MKTNEANELRIQNHALMEENARSRAFIEKLLRHPAFTPFLEDLSRDESINNTIPMTQPAAPAIATTPAPDAKDVNSYAQQFQNTPRPQNNVQVGMTLVPETPLDLSMLSLNNNNWGIGNMGFNYQQPRVFAVIEVPEGPANPIDTSALSGKGYESIMGENEDRDHESSKDDCPVVQHSRENAKATEVTKPAETEEEKAFDNDSSFALYHSANLSSSVSNFSAPIDLGNLNFEKSSQYKLVVSDNAEDERSLEELLEKMSAKLDGIFDRVRNLTHHLDT